ncbi:MULTISPECIES: sigma-70 family RNA polymerase sigma factor [Micromonospora]|uniref:RNA polymerase sigma-70 factor, ECF subfamily n=1 Tax=Micromonospora yangpuensis TaxID=683228 RepID=A0A1C6UVC1_9ACTN|nr:sigma-70 family RNA polymerase sigma factor [Micromonospora yangpuensis]GGM26035.1 RNA polymerase sigma factor SigL [Micromonospora yangpuensis]SCL58034.1 RNA polymerase sigma-70 factor, ECF subfamily [Micromonospora yangpuensis]
MDSEGCPDVRAASDTDAQRERRMRAVFSANARPLYYFLLKLTHGQRELAEDLVQETMLRAWRRLPELPEDPELIRRWLFVAARYVAIDVARARSVRPAEVYGMDVRCAPAPAGEFDELLDRFTLADALRKLSPEHRTVLVELYYGDASTAEAAARIGIPAGTVRSRSFYALRAARNILGDVEALAC